MWATIGATLKKIAVTLLTNPKVLKVVGGIVLGIIIIIIMPVIAVVSVFNGNVELDTNKLQQYIQENVTAEQEEQLELMEKTMTKVEKQLADKKLSKYNTQAEVIYLMCLVDKSEDKNFVKDFVSCFKKKQTDEELIDAVNKKFDLDIKYDEFKQIMQTIKATEINTSNFTDVTTKNNLDLVKWCKNAVKNGWGYVWGGYGQVCTESFLDRQAELFPADNQAGGTMRETGEKWLGKRVTDCIGLIKSYAWYNPENGEIVAGSNSFTDCNANTIWDYVKESGDISTIPETPGLAVWMNGHIGVYIGNGKVVEAQGTAYGVVKTQLKNRGWTKWLKIPNIKYIEKLKQPNLKKITRKNEVITLKKSSVNVLFDAEKLSAVKMYMSQRDLDFKNELEKSIEVMYSKYVPSNVREFIDMKSALTKPIKSKTETAPPEENFTGDAE